MLASRPASGCLDTAIFDAPIFSLKGGDNKLQEYFVKFPFWGGSGGFLGGFIADCYILIFMVFCTRSRGGKCKISERQFLRSPRYPHINLTLYEY